LVRLEFTSSGARLYKTNMQKKQHVIGSVLSVLSKEDQKDMLRIYNKLVDSLTKFTS